MFITAVLFLTFDQTTMAEEQKYFWLVCLLMGYLKATHLNIPRIPRFFREKRTDFEDSNSSNRTSVLNGRRGETEWKNCDAHKYLWFPKTFPTFALQFKTYHKTSNNETMSVRREGEMRCNGRDHNYSFTFPSRCTETIETQLNSVYL